MTSEPVIQVSDLRLEYGRKTAVDGISFDVFQGEVVALLGTNGAGKTTTLDVLEGYLKPTAGSVSVFGQDPHTHRNRIASDIGIMLQEAGFFGELTVAETIKAWRRFTPDAVSTDEALRLVDLQDRSRTRVGRLSGGERRRLDLSLAVLGRPKLLFLDEPTTGLDPESRRHTWRFLKDMVAEGMTVLLTTHYMEEAEFLADRVAIMDHGRIVRHGTVTDVLAQDAGTRISVLADSLISARTLPPFPGAEVHEADGRVSLVTDEPQAALKTLLRWADDNNAKLRGLEVRTASLEDVFLDVAATGKGQA
ncbi:ABC transporter ATPase [Streptomyces sp. NRRL F-5755]|uniref:ABC transporter ATP-binding protein n=1 Tax=Streptomyces sp. NRRL F-5755 TaxID=1519475 RepID=UPI0006AE9D2F|nr:ABC transporter ATP-binding protein [Streptomyces sp. NRRL F-5755]KOU02368.1 ABC transporter ATPase [Streptomyces sp. NRRL F-5755]